MFGLCSTDAALDTIDAVVYAKDEEGKRDALISPLVNLLSADPESASWRDVYEAVGALVMVADQMLGRHAYTSDHSDPFFHDPKIGKQIPGFEIGMLSLDPETLDTARKAADRAVEAQDWPAVMSGWSRREDQQQEISQMRELRCRIYGESD
jgi:hypothetical protein